ncbi:hypothetical protein GGI35DRAFT_159048 [Trichoderma velutinum]
MLVRVHQPLALLAAAFLSATSVALARAYWYVGATTCMRTCQVSVVAMVSSAAFHLEQGENKGHGEQLTPFLGEHPRAAKNPT